MKQFSVSMTVVGTIIGAGFVTGKEIACFFSRFGISSIISSIACIVLFAVFIFIALRSKHLFRVKHNFLSYLLFFANWVISLAMVSGCFFILQGLLGLPSFMLAVALFALLFFVLYKEQKAFLLICSLSVPILVLCLVAICVYALATNQVSNTISMEYHSSLLSVWFCIIYVANNFLVGFSVFETLGKSLNKKQAVAVSVVSATIIGLIVVLYNLALLFHPSAVSTEMPIFALLGNLSPNLVLAIKLITLVGMFTTLFATQQAQLQLLTNGIKMFNKKSTNTLFVCAIGLFGCVINFSNIVEVLYPLLGVLGVFLVVYLFKCPKPLVS